MYDTHNSAGGSVQADHAPHEHEKHNGARP